MLPRKTRHEPQLGVEYTACFFAEASCVTMGQDNLVTSSSHEQLLASARKTGTEGGLEALTLGSVL